MIGNGKIKLNIVERNFRNRKPAIRHEPALSIFHGNPGTVGTHLGNFESARPPGSHSQLSLSVDLDLRHAQQTVALTPLGAATDTASEAA